MSFKSSGKILNAFFNRFMQVKNLPFYMIRITINISCQVKALRGILEASLHFHENYQRCV